MNIAPFRLERYFARYEFDVPFLMSSSDSESVRIEDLLTADEAKEFMKLGLGYTPSDGTQELRREIGRLYANCSEDHILVHSGAEEAIFTFFHAALRPGDHVIVQYPCYQSLYEIAVSIGCEVSYWPLRREHSWVADLDDLTRLLRRTTRLIVINSPHNPTGFHFSQEEWIRMAALADAQNVLLFSDEVYRFAAYRNADELPPMSDLTKKAVSLGVLSKSFGLAGLRIGWLATQDPSLLDAVRPVKDYTTICNSAPSEFLAVAALRSARKLLDRNRAIIAENLQVADDFFERHKDRFLWIRPSGGPVAFPLDLKADVAAYADRLARQSGTMILPGEVYGEPFKRHFRLGLGRKNFSQALEKFESALAFS